MIKRIALCVAYEGSRYHGWQHQEEVSSVQQVLEQALSRVANHPVTLICAGRTDAGVHATGQVVHFDTEADRSDHAWIFGANSNLPHDISVQWAQEVSLDFHARFSALSRTYQYFLCNQLIRPGILQKSISWVYKSLNLELMQQACLPLIGEHDFSAFRGAGCQANHAVRRIHRLGVKKQGNMFVVEVQANAFLLHMVRNIVGVLTDIGTGVKPPEWSAEVLLSRDRKVAGMTSSPHGLYLVKVEYPAHFNLPDTSTVGPCFYNELA